MTPSLLSLLLLAALPRISSVVVYPDRAQVIRTVAIDCSAKGVARFDGLPPATRLETFRARTDLGSVEGLRSEEQTRHEGFAPQLKAIEEQLRRLDQEIAVQRDALARAGRELRVGQRYGELAAALVAHELSAPRPDVKAWGSAFETALGTRLRAVAQQGGATARLRELGEQRAELDRSRERLAAASQRHEYVAEVLVSCPAGRQARVELSYLVGGAGWTPAYEARADEAGTAVTLSTFATVTQATGEDWTQARLTLSTATPLQDATPPELRPLKVVSQQREAERKVLVRRDENQEHAEVSKAEPAGDKVSGKLRPTSQGLSVQLAVPEPVDVPGDGKQVRLFVASQRLRATFAFRAVPKLMPFVFRVADLTNGGAFPLLPGPLDAFTRNGFIARYTLERIAQGAPFHLTFGIEDTLRVKRTVVEEIKRDAGLFGSHSRFHYDYVFDVANYKGAPEELELSEHIPVSELEDVKVELDPKTSPGFERVPQDGILRWRLKLAPAEKRKVELAFHVDVPSSYDNGGL